MNEKVTIFVFDKVKEKYNGISGELIKSNSSEITIFSEGREITFPKHQIERIERMKEGKKEWKEKGFLEHVLD